MLFDKDVLAALDKKLQDKYPDFNIHIFLLMLQNTTRPLGYPPHHDGPNNDYYLELLSQRITDAQSTKNAHQLQSLMNSLYQIMICFSYFQNALYKNGFDEELLSLLFSAIDTRIATTAEERCAEKCCLLLLLKRPQELIKLIASYSTELSFVNMQQLVQNQISNYGTRHLKKAISELPDKTPVADTIDELSNMLDILKSSNEGLKQLAPFANVSAKRKCQIIIGTYLLDNIENTMMQPWVSTCLFLKSATVLALQEKGKNETQGYIATRNKELKLFSLFGKYSKETKLSSADKFLQLLNNERDIVFSSEEHEALQEDTDSRLTEIYLRYQTVVPVIA